MLVLTIVDAVLEKNNEDIMHYLLIASDPLISSLRIKKEKKVKQLSEEAKSLLKNSITQCE